MKFKKETMTNFLICCTVITGILVFSAFVFFPVYILYLVLLHCFAILAFVTLNTWYKSSKD